MNVLEREIGRVLLRHGRRRMNAKQRAANLGPPGGPTPRVSRPPQFCGTSVKITRYVLITPTTKMPKMIVGFDL
jgi:hypothetical protein